HASEACQVACIQAVQSIRSGQRKRIVILDDKDEIMDEYQKNLNFSGEPGVGDKFFKYLYYHQHSTQHTRRVLITKINDDDRSFEELPANNLDPSDRKFLAAAIVAEAPIMNATDSDWQEQQALLDRLSVTVEQLCPDADGGSLRWPRGRGS
ncbi:MAG: hypothetical protein ERJ69_09895, partial [Aphanocapsa feldmannii 288cV]